MNAEYRKTTLREQSRTHAQLSTLINHVNAESLKAEHRKQPAFEKLEYNERLDENITELLREMKQFSYYPQQARRRACYEDTLVQGVFAGILSEIYEERFCDTSFGFRSGKYLQSAVKYISETLMYRNASYVLEAGIRDIFNSIDRDWLMKFLEHDISDLCFLKYIRRFLSAGYLEAGAWTANGAADNSGTAPGGKISQILANVYLHYVLDLWAETLKKKLSGEVYYARYADEFIMLFQNRNEAESVMCLLIKRLARFGLEACPERTRILQFGCFEEVGESFSFPGFAFIGSQR